MFAMDELVGAEQAHEILGRNDSVLEAFDGLVDFGSLQHVLHDIQDEPMEYHGVAKLLLEMLYALPPLLALIEAFPLPFLVEFEQPFVYLPNVLVDCLCHFTNIMSQIKLADLLTPHLESLKAVELLIEGFELRLEAEDQYERALVRIAQKFNPPNASKSDCYGLLLGELSRIHSERSYQVNYFCEQVKADVQQLRAAAKGISAELDNRLK